MRWKGFLLVVLLGASVGSVGCGSPTRDETVAEQPLPAKATTNVPDLTMIFEGLVDVDYRDLSGAPVLSVLMVDATKNNVLVPSCVDPSLSHHYPAHEPAIFVQDAEVTENGSPINPPIIYLSNHDVTVSTGAPGFGSVDLMALVSSDELQRGFGDGTAALNVESRYYTDPIEDKADDALIARIRLDGADTVEARTNVCEKQQGLPLPRQRHFRFEAEPGQNTTKCRYPPKPGTTPVQLGEDVVVTRNTVSTVTLTLSKQNSASRTITIKGAPGRPFGIAFRNTLPDFHQERIDECTAMPEHYTSYRWFYRLEASQGARCNVAPCVACGTNDPSFICPVAGFKCPIP